MNSYPFLETTFYYSKTNPMQHMLNQKQPNQIALCKQSAKGRAFGAMDFAMLDKNYTQNHHLYEISSEKRRMYFDVEYYADEQEREKQWKYIQEWLIEFVKQFTEIKQIFITNGSGQKDGLYRSSYHIVFHTVHYLDGTYKLFKSHLENALFKNENAYLICPFKKKSAIDTAVYAKNQQFKLPLQSKYGENRIHEILENENVSLKDYLISPINIQQEAISLNITAPTENIENKVNESVKRLKTQNPKTPITFDQKQLIYDMTKAFEGIESKEWNGSYAVCDILNLIPNTGKMSRRLWFAFICSMKNAIAHNIEKSDDDGLNLFLTWSKQYETYNERECVDAYNAIDVKKGGYSMGTLQLIASYCCPALKTNKYFIERLKIQRLPDLTLNTNHFDFNRHQNKELQFVKSGMGTGKTYALHKLPKNKSCVFLSSRQAFANSQSFEFKDDGFVNYLDETTNYSESRIIVSLESISHLLRDTYDYLIIDESESIFNIISSSTLNKNRDIFEKSTRTLENLIRKCGKIIVMDAFLSERSIQSVETIRQKKGYFIHNTFPAPKRTANIVSKNQLVGEMVKKLNDNKRCVFVCGSKTFAEFALEHIKRDIKEKTILFYNAENKLPLHTDVNTEWAKADLLIYTPSITCGISYANTEMKFDNLFLYAVNTHSAHFRDMIQASRRCREITDSHITVCLNTQYKINEYFYPTHCDVINYQKRKYANLLNTSFEVKIPIETLDGMNPWINEVDTYNKMERNIHSVYLEEVAKYYFEMENITIEKTNNFDYELDETLRKNTFIQGSDIKLIDEEQYRTYIETMKTNTLCLEEMAEYRYYIFYYWLKMEYRQNKKSVDILYDEWAEDPILLRNIKAFKTMMYDSSLPSRNLINNEIAEHIEKTRLPLHEFRSMCSKLKVIDEEHLCLDCSKTFSREDLENLGYEKQTVSVINRICNKQVFKKENIGIDGKINKFCGKKVATILNTLANNIGYKMNRKVVARPRVNKKQICVYGYQFQPKCENEILSKMCPYFQNYDFDEGFE
tara:strand:+ start:1283 stop:4369 length:3087 start_codon:yes stop_codon:yes gene_type:complete